MTALKNEFDNVSVVKKGNIYFDGKCVSHTVQFADGTKKTVGVILPSTLTFNTGVPETMETVAGKCRYRIKDGDWKTWAAIDPADTCNPGGLGLPTDRPVVSWPWR